MNKVKPKVDSALEASVKTSSDSPFSFVLHGESRMTHQYNQTATSHLLNSTEVSSTKLSKIG
jgi:hypothetical protein